MISITKVEYKYPTEAKSSNCYTDQDFPATMPSSRNGQWFLPLPPTPTPSSTRPAPKHTSRDKARPERRLTWVQPKAARRLQTHPHIVKSRHSHILNKCRSFQLMVSLHLLVTVLSFYIAIFFYHLGLISPSSTLLAPLLSALLRSTQHSTPSTRTCRTEVSLNASLLHGDTHLVRGKKPKQGYKLSPDFLHKSRGEREGIEYGLNTGVSCFTPLPLLLLYRAGSVLLTP